MRTFAVAACALLAGCSGSSDNATRMEVERGALALRQYGCGSCHRIPGVASADGIVGPPLTEMRRRVYIARGLPNSPENMVRFIRAPQALAPRTAMPDMQVSADDATAIAAFLYRTE
jgi:cytochrome c2